MKIKVVGLVGSPRKKRNTEFLVKEALEGAEEVGDVETELVTFWNKKIEPCIACYRCDLAPETEERMCPAIDDDFEYVAKKCIEADGIIIGAPVYVGDVPAQMKAFMDRCEAIAGYSKRPWLRMPLRNKVGGAVTVGALRQGGQEATLWTIHRFMLFKGMIVVGSQEGPATRIGSYGGGIGVLYPGSSLKGVAVKKDDLGILSARLLGRRVALIAKMVKSNFEADREEWQKWFEATFKDWIETHFPAKKKMKTNARYDN